MLHFQRTNTDSFSSTIFNFETDHLQLVIETNICNLNALYPESLMLFRGILLCIHLGRAGFRARRPRQGPWAPR